LSEPFIQGGQKIGFLRYLPEFRARKFRELLEDFIETHPQILAHLDLEHHVSIL
jgi:hypothetical protein